MEDLSQSKMPPPWKNQNRPNENSGEKPFPEGGPHFGDPRPPRGFNSPNFRPRPGQPPFEARGRGMGRGDAYFEHRNERPWIRRGGGNFQSRPRGPMEPSFMGPRHPRQGPPHPPGDFDMVNPPHDCPPPGMLESQEEAHSMNSKGNGPPFLLRGDGQRQPFPPRGSRQRFERPHPPRGGRGDVFPRSQHGHPLPRGPRGALLDTPPRDSFRGGFRPRFRGPVAPHQNSHIPTMFQQDDSRKRKHPMMEQEQFHQSGTEGNPDPHEGDNPIEESGNNGEEFESRGDQEIQETQEVVDVNNGQSETAQEEKEIPPLFSKTYEHEGGEEGFAQGGFGAGKQGQGEVNQEDEVPQAKRQAFAAGVDEEGVAGEGEAEDMAEDQGGEQVMEEASQDWEGGKPGVEGRGRGFRGRPRGSRGFGPRFGGRFPRPNWRTPHDVRQRPPDFGDYPEDHIDPIDDHMDPPEFMGPPRGFMGPRGRLGPPGGHRGHPRPHMGPPRGFREPFPDFRPPHPDHMGGPRDFMGPPHPDDIDPPHWDRLGPPRDHRGPPRDFRHPPHDHRGPGDMMGPPPDHMGPRPTFHSRDYDFREEEFHPDDRHRPLLDDRFGDRDRNFYPGDDPERHFDRRDLELEGRGRPFGDDMEMCDEDLERERGPRFFEGNRYERDVGEPYGDLPIGRDFPPRGRGRGGVGIKFESHDWNHGASPHQGKTVRVFSIIVVYLLCE